MAAMAEQGRVTSTDYENPYRPLPIRMLNRIGKVGGNLGLTPALSVETLVNQAKRKTGLADFGDDGHLRALQVLVGSINDEARLTATGRFIQTLRLADALVYRLRIEDLLKRHPEILDIELGKVVLVTGLQRTGTTLLQRLLNSHPEIEGVSSSEALDPVPAANAKQGGADARKRRARLAQGLISYLSPQFTAVHPIDHNEPEEDVLLLDLNFMSQSAEAIMHVPSYSRWLEGQEHTRTYEYFLKVLKVLCWQCPRSRWVLKTPHHMEYLDVFLKVFPDATIVQTHRDPRKALPSFCSMVAHGRGIFSDCVEPKQVGSHWCRKTRRMIELTMHARAGTDDTRFLDVSYYDLVKDPVAELRRICRHAGIGFDDNAERAAENYMKANPQNRFGKHAYRLGDFGLSEEIVEEAFSSYRQKHSVPFE